MPTSPATAKSHGLAHSPSASSSAAIASIRSHSPSARAPVAGVARRRRSPSRGSPAPGRGGRPSRRPRGPRPATPGRRTPRGSSAMRISALNRPSRSANTSPPRRSASASSGRPLGRERPAPARQELGHDRAEPEPLGDRQDRLDQLERGVVVAAHQLGPGELGGQADPVGLLVGVAPERGADRLGLGPRDRAGRPLAMTAPVRIVPGPGREAGIAAARADLDQLARDRARPRRTGRAPAGRRRAASSSRAALGVVVGQRRPHRPGSRPR